MTATSGKAEHTPGPVPPPAPPGAASASCRVRSALDRIGDKWAIYVVDRLGQGPRRFSELRRG
ncbi:MAG: helix-turn-helix transcriptional regulator, partial [Nocardiopsaceae bacterium]|nr:helix-turn-helix transcriptional regulator [Nocardiopsaceae bacterium]